MAENPAFHKTSCMDVGKVDGSRQGSIGPADLTNQNDDAISMVTDVTSSS